VRHALDRIEVLSGGEEVPNGNYSFTFPLERSLQEKKFRFKDGVLPPV
jgi:hypothetical protein